VTPDPMQVVSLASDILGYSTPKRKNVRCSNADTSRLGDQIWAVNSVIQPCEDESSEA
jgi:hypothetical protein